MTSQVSPPATESNDPGSSQIQVRSPVAGIVMNLTRDSKIVICAGTARRHRDGYVTVTGNCTSMASSVYWRHDSVPRDH